ncbi:hypothetical protein [Saccharospirillum impatiens]|uniref:hypothetical protein n=1 Tax=Saccharospirillum impatiens TaxID=169438 RepID=UPI000403D6F0|nr:hypothetical protein [Saccharospirillum impatiens]
MDCKKLIALSIAVSLLVLVGCNPGSSNPDSSNSSTGSLVGIECEYGTFSQVTAMNNHRFRVSIPRGECIGTQNSNAYRKALPVEIGILDSRLSVSATAKVYGGYQPTYSITVENNSDDDLCFIKFSNLSAQNLEGESLVSVPMEFLHGDMMENKYVRTISCLMANSTGIVADYLDFDPVDLTTAAQIHIGEISAQVLSDSVPVTGISLNSFTWGEDMEVAEYMNGTGETVDLSQTYRTIEYFDEQGYLIASLFLENNENSNLVQAGETFDSYRRSFRSEKISELQLGVDWDAYDLSAKSTIVRSQNYFSLQELKRMRRDSELQKESLFLSYR